MPARDLIGPIAALFALVVTLVFGVRYDRRHRDRRSDALAKIREQERAKALRTGKLSEVHAEIKNEAATAAAKIEPTEADVDVTRRKIAALWRKLKMRGRL